MEYMVLGRLALHTNTLRKAMALLKHLASDARRIGREGVAKASQNLI